MGYFRQYLLSHGAKVMPALGDWETGRLGDDRVSMFPIYQRITAIHRPREYAPEQASVHAGAHVAIWTSSCIRSSLRYQHSWAFFPEAALCGVVPSDFVPD